MFLTALAPNAAALALVKQATGSRSLDAVAAGRVAGRRPAAGARSAARVRRLSPRHPVEPEVPAWAAQELRRMGPLGRHEVAMAAVVALAIVLWIVGANRDIALPLVGSQFIDATGVVLLAIVLMLGSGVVEWDDILGSKGAWNVLVWFATLVALAEGLNRVGVVAGLGREGFRRAARRHSPRDRARDPGRVLLPRALHVREPDRPRRSGAARRARDGDGGAGTARAAVRAAARLLARPDGRALAVRDGSGAGLLRERLHLPPRLLALGLLFGLVFLGMLLLNGLVSLVITISSSLIPNH